MSKLYIAGGRRGSLLRILEVSTPVEAKETFIKIKARAPRSNYAVFGAKDIETLKRTQPSLSVAKVTNSLDEFIHAVRVVPDLRKGQVNLIRNARYYRKVHLKAIGVKKHEADIAKQQ